jgi:hypothetical protein
MPQIERSADRTSIRRDVGPLLGDYVLLKSTAPGTTTTLIDMNNVLYSSYEGRMLYFAGGSNAGHQRKVLSSNVSTGTVEWANPLPFDTALYDEAELWNRHGNSWTAAEVNDAIRIAHKRALEHFPLPHSEETGTWTNGTDIDVSEEFWGITAVEWLDYNGGWHGIQRASGPGGAGYWLNRGSRTISIGGPYYQGRHTGFPLRIRGYLREDELDHDSAETQLNTEWIAVEACRIILGASKGMKSNDREIESRYRDFAAEAAAKRVMVRGRREPTLDLVY